MSMNKIVIKAPVTPHFSLGQTEIATGSLIVSVCSVLSRVRLSCS